MAEFHMFTELIDLPGGLWTYTIEFVFPDDDVMTFDCVEVFVSKRAAKRDAKRRLNEIINMTTPDGGKLEVKTMVKSDGW